MRNLNFQERILANITSATDRIYVAVAVMILQKKTGIPASTIHRSIYNFEDLQERKKGDSFKFFFGLNENQVSVDAVYIIDEASMISDKYSEDEFFMFGSGLLLKDLFEYVSVS